MKYTKKLRPGEPPTVESASSLLNALFFDAKRYDLAKVKLDISLIRNLLYATE